MLHYHHVYVKSKTEGTRQYDCNTPLLRAGKHPMSLVEFV